MLTDEQINQLKNDYGYAYKDTPSVESAAFVEGAIAGCSTATAPLLEKIERLKNRCGELEKDAGRYRWLRDEAQWIEGVPQAIIWNNQGHAQEICAEDELDAAIDSAMSGQDKA